MSATVYNNELNHIISESKRKNVELRTAAEASLQDLKAITVTSEQQLAADLGRRPTFVEPFLKACATGQTRFAAAGVSGLQRLIISQGLPKSRLNEALLALNVCAELGHDLQLKVLQALPSLLQNYSAELRDDLLGTVLQVCAALQGAKVSTVSAVAAATLQQLVAEVFGRVVEEDLHRASIAPVIDISAHDGTLSLRPAAHDAYRLLKDLVLAAEGRKTRFVQFSTLNREDCLLLIKSCIEAQPELVESHEELASIVRSNVMPLLTSALSESLPFTITVRLVRILSGLILNHFDKFSDQFEVIFGLFAHAVESESSFMWKRVILMEVLRDVFTENGFIVRAYVAYDKASNGKPVIHDILAAFVRLSAEKPTIIGLGQQSSMPAGPATKDEAVSDITAGMAGVFSSLGVVETSIQGISEQWSIPKASTYDQLDKTEAPAVPDTYIYSLVLQALSGLSDSLARVVLPLSVRHHEDATFSVPLNPLEREDLPSSEPVEAVADLVENCWPAFLAVCSTFLNAALDDGYYRSLIKSYQRFTQVAGLLRLHTPRDALITTLGKSAVPPQVLNAATTDAVRSTTTDTPRSASGSKSILSIEGLVGQSMSGDKDRRTSSDTIKAVLTVRNLLCLRALLNLAIALGPTLEHAFGMVLEVVRHADIVLGSQSMGKSSTSTIDPPTFVQSFSSEVTAVENAASRLLESTADFPNDAFVNVLNAFCSMIQRAVSVEKMATIQERSPLPVTAPSHQRKSSVLPGLSVNTDSHMKDLQFALPKLGTLAALNVHRFVKHPPDQSGWQQLSSDILAIAVSNKNPANARRAAADILTKLTAECIFEVSQEADNLRKEIQDRSFLLLLNVIRGIYNEDGELTGVDLEIQSLVMASLKIILERAGESIISGWDMLIAILSTAFEHDHGAIVAPDSMNWKHISDAFVALRLGREAFTTTQLICGEFLLSTPTTIRSSIVELLYRFMRQKEDLNLSLTATTATWNVADVLAGTTNESNLVIDGSRFEDALSEAGKNSTLAQWLLILVKLRSIVGKGQRETARAAFQTICGIIKHDLARSSTSVSVTIFHHILIGVLADDAASESHDRGSTIDLLHGFSASVTDQFQHLTTSSNSDTLWSEMIRIFATLLTKNNVDIDTAVYTTLTNILATLEPALNEPVTQVTRLWTEQDPSSRMVEQPVLIAYTELAAQLLRLAGNDIQPDLVKTLIQNLCHCIKVSDATIHTADSQVMSQLQTLILRILRTIPRTHHAVTTYLLTAAADLVLLPWSVQQRPTKPSFVALSADVMSWIEHLLLDTLSSELLAEESFCIVINALSQIIEEKYSFQLDHKGVSLWTKATLVTIAIARPVLTLADQLEHSESRYRVWRVFVRSARSVVQANELETYKNLDRIYSDEQGDIMAFRQLNDAMIPKLGYLPSELLEEYAMSIFEASIIHPLDRVELPSAPVLSDLAKIRRGRSKEINPCQREEMSYECFRHLIELSSSPASMEECTNLAKSCAEWLVLRLAVPLRAYIADQPLRGHMPQPLSELEELLFCFDQIKTLRLPLGILVSPHLHYLYPLLIKVARVAGDRRCGSDEVLLPLQDLLAALPVS